MLYETVKEQDNFVSITHACVLTDILVAIGYIVARYAAYGKSYILVEALPKLMLYGNMALKEYMVSRQNIALGFALCYICSLPNLLYFPYSTSSNVLTYT